MKHLVDIDDEALAAAQRRLGTSTMTNTINTALRLAAAEEPNPSDVVTALDTLAGFHFDDRDEAWR
jgi:Arc/MetJ family transcription regulator